MYFLFVLVTVVVFVNGWTDAPNAITCLVSTGTVPYRKAVCLAAFFNLLGLLAMSLLNASVADTITGMVRIDFSGSRESVVILCAAMLSIVLFAVTAWYFGIPTSESHALIAGLTGAVMAQGRLEAVNFDVCSKVLWGLLLSLVLGFGLGWLLSRLLKHPLRLLGDKAMDAAQLLSAAGMAFMHGAQDGQKFVAVFVLASYAAQGIRPETAVHLRDHVPTMLLCAVAISLGTLVGGKRIIAQVGEKMVHLEKYQGTCADLGGSLCLLLGSLWGIPMSTTHTKTTAIMGAGTADGSGRLNLSVVKGMVAAWIFTFPVCGMIGYLTAALLLRI